MGRTGLVPVSLLIHEEHNETSGRMDLGLIKIRIDDQTGKLSAT